MKTYPNTKLFTKREGIQENTKAPLSVLGEDPIPLRYNSLIEATDALKITVSQFKEYFNGDPEKKQFIRYSGHSIMKNGYYCIINI